MNHLMPHTGGSHLFVLCLKDSKHKLTTGDVDWNEKYKTGYIAREVGVYSFKV